MSESVSLTTESPAESITRVMNDWLSMEIMNSGVNRNSYLNEAVGFAENGLAKNQAHFNRLEEFTETFATYPDNPDAIRNQLFCVQMGLSGTFRTQCFILAKSADDYMERRNKGNFDALSDVDTAVTDHIVDRYGKPLTSSDLPNVSVDVDDLITDTTRVNSFRYEALKRMYEDPTRNQGHKALFNTLRLSRLQKLWMGLAVDYILYAAQLDDGHFDNILFLEPKTITEARPFKPFQKQDLLTTRSGKCALRDVSVS